MTEEQVPHVLVIEPSGVLRKKLCEMITACGFKPIQATTGKDALKKLRDTEAPIKLVTLEWFLPDSNGFDVLQVIKKIDESISVILITTQSNKSCVVRALSSGASDYVIKPFSVQKIKSKIQHLVQL